MRTAEITRSTKETQITVWLSLDGGPVEISTGVGFFDHMLNSFAVHGGLGLKVHTEGDLYVDCHHTIEDTGIVIGQAYVRLWGIREEFSGLVPFLSRWTKRWRFPRWISAAGRF